MDPLLIGIVVGLVVAGISGLVKLIFRGIEKHLEKQDAAIESVSKRVGTIEVNIGEIKGILHRKGIEDRLSRLRPPHN